MTNQTNKTYVDSMAEHLARPFMDAVENTPVAFLPANYEAQEFAHLMPSPQRAKGERVLHATDSFVAYVNALKTDQTRIYANIDAGKSSATIVAVFNDHVRGLPGWGDHIARYSPRASVEWVTWLGADGKSMTQAEFATFVETNMQDIASGDNLPTGSQMYQMALSLEASQEARIKSAIRLQSGGVELTYVNQEDDATLQRMQVFERFAIGVAPIEGGDHYKVEARLRYRTRDAKVSFWYELRRPDRTYADALQAEVSKIETGLTTNVLLGAAP